MLLIDERVTSCNAALCSRSVLPLLVLHPEVNIHPETFTFFPHTFQSETAVHGVVFKDAKIKRRLLKWTAVVIGSSLT